jgi:hypothetical protein
MLVTGEPSRDPHRAGLEDLREGYRALCDVTFCIRATYYLTGFGTVTQVTPVRLSLHRLLGFHLLPMTLGSVHSPCASCVRPNGRRRRNVFKRALTWSLDCAQTFLFIVAICNIVLVGPYLPVVQSAIHGSFA